MDDEARHRLYKDVDEYIISILKVVQSNTIEAEKYEGSNRRCKRDFYPEVRARIEDIIEALEDGDL